MSQARHFTFTAPTAAALVTVAALALTACSASDERADSKPKNKPSTTDSKPTQKQKDEAAQSAGLPPEPAAAERVKLLQALAAAAPRR